MLTVFAQRCLFALSIGALLQSPILAQAEAAGILQIKKNNVDLSEDCKNYPSCKKIAGILKKRSIGDALKYIRDFDLRGSIGERKLQIIGVSGMLLEFSAIDKSGNIRAAYYDIYHAQQLAFDQVLHDMSADDRERLRKLLNAEKGYRCSNGDCYDSKMKISPVSASDPPIAAAAIFMKALVTTSAQNNRSVPFDRSLQAAVDRAERSYDRCEPLELGPLTTSTDDVKKVIQTMRIDKVSDDGVTATVRIRYRFHNGPEDEYYTFMRSKDIWYFYDNCSTADLKSKYCYRHLAFNYKCK